MNATATDKEKTFRKYFFRFKHLVSLARAPNLKFCWFHTGKVGNHIEPRWVHLRTICFYFIIET